MPAAGSSAEAEPEEWPWRAGLRLVAHVSVWALFVSGVAGAVHRGWRAVGDGAAIAVRGAARPPRKASASSMRKPSPW